ncbi:MAG: hypothetical protein RR034_05530 [Bacteroidales bacterium]
MKQKSIKPLLTGIALVVAFMFNACNKDQPDDKLVASSSSTLSGETLSTDTVYLIQGFVYVTDGSTLSIPAGTILKGDKASKGTLIIERGGKIMAQGTKERPIVFTSNQAKGKRNYGDWGGIIICGKAAVNNTAGESKIEGGPRSFFGGGANPNPADNSGILTYVRIEFSGIEYGTDNEINGLTMGAVGSGTTLHHIQVSFCGDDSFEWFGGNVNAKYLVAYRGWDDEFDTDNGFTGKLQFLVGMRDKNVADKSKSNGFESDNDAAGSSNSPFTSPVFSNVTLIGPYLTLSDTNTIPTGGNGDFQAAMHLRRNSKLKVYNSLFTGWPYGLFIEDGGKGSAQTNAQNGELIVKNCILAGMKRNFKEDPSGAGGINFNQQYYQQSNLNNQLKTTVSELGITSLSLNSKPNFALSSSSLLLNGADFSDAHLNGFEPVSFVGAFGTADWTQGWCNFDPQHTDY